MTRRTRIGAVAGVMAIVLAACGTTGSGGSAAGITPSPSIAPSASASPEPFAEAIIETGPGPIVLTATSESIWVELHRADQVARIDPGTNELVPSSATNRARRATSAVVTTRDRDRGEGD